MRRVAVRPFDGFGRPVVVADIAYELLPEITDRSEDSSGDHVAFDLGKPVFDLVEPRGVGGRVGDGRWDEPRGILGRASSYERRDCRR